MEQKLSIRAFVATFVLLSLALFGFTSSKQDQYKESIKGRLHSVVIDIGTQLEADIKAVEETTQDFVEEDVEAQESTQDNTLATENISNNMDAEFVASNSRALISVVIYDYGLSTKASEDIARSQIDGLTLSISPYAKEDVNWVGKAKISNAEPWTSVYLTNNSSNKDYGYLSILEGLSTELNNKRLEISLKNSFDTYGVINFHESNKAGKETSLLHEALKDKGLSIAIFSKRTSFWEDDALISPYMLPYNKNKDEIDHLFNIVRLSALKNGTAFVAIPPHPLVLKRLVKWSKQLENSAIRIVPLSILMEHS